MKNRITLPKTLLFFWILMMWFNSAVIAQSLPYHNDYAFGLDLSFVKQREDNGEKYFDIDGAEKPVLKIFNDHGYNWARLMICNEPVSDGLVQDLEYVVNGAKDLQKYNYHFALDMMFSNGWANPMKQPTPSSWVDMTHEERIVAVYEFVLNTLTTLKNEDVLPEMVQIGNEIGNGFLWPDGRINYATPQESKWKNVADYLKAGVKAIREVEGNGNKIEIMVHVDHGGDIAFSQTFFDKMEVYNVDYDVIGYSFYPWSHGTLLDLRDNLRMTALRYGKEIIVIETGYYWRENTYHENAPYPFPETPEGQKQWFQAVNEIVLDTPNGLGRGVFWWEPMARGRGFFDDETKVAQPIVRAFEKYSLPENRTDWQNRIQ
ncbi:glycosyl hydrolase 53 family protein [Echinicola jeungdonensis]|uniref:Arabinogalactan endo-beta-1,4-galactanase n=1 Tax=Echinicola jeungdonensis TaxID=709343 RepID=A0ABV5J896_9BACT|nr:glycosyl hydrolase 53 family protein [Echinicola jeungdonensis]MDN3669504.1 glycosyl hydrolase 53 family protein [Echinicola jeungdonensis]